MTKAAADGELGFSLSPSMLEQVECRLWFEFCTQARDNIQCTNAASEVGIHTTLTFGTPSTVHNRYCRQTAAQLLSVLRLVISVHNANTTHHTESCHGKVETFQG